MDPLFSKYSASDSASNGSGSGDPLFTKYGLNSSDVALSPEDSPALVSSDINDKAYHGMVKGFNNVINSISVGVNALKAKLGDTSTQAYNDAVIKKQNEDYQAKYGDSTAASIGRIAGEALATAPLVPARAVQAVESVMDALPVIKGGVAEAAPLVNRLSAAVNTGALGGAVYGVATSAANPDKSLGENVLENTAAGAIGGPILKGVGIAAGKAASSLWANVNAAKIANAQGLNTNAVKYTIQKLDEAGISPQQAMQELQRLGPQATLADIDPLMLDVGEGVAKSGGTGSSLMKGRFGARADQANNQAMQIMNNRLGGAPNKDALKDQIYQDAIRQTAPDYKAAYASGQQIDVFPVIQNIDDQLTNAVGPEAKILRMAKSYLYKKDADGNDILKDDIPSLHKVRMAMDDAIDRASSPVTSQGKNTLRAIQNVRNQLDAQLKTNPQMAAADQNFAQKMQASQGVDYGYNALNDRNSNYLDFQKDFSNASPETQKAISQGMHARVADLMEQASNGELGAAQKLFGKNSANRAKFQLALGQDANDVLDALQKEAQFRTTEKTIEGGSRTAQIQAIQQELGIRPSGESILGAGAKSAMFDVLAGTPGVAAGISAVRQAGTKGLTRYTEFNTANKVAGVGDILSRQGAERDNAVDILRRVQAVRSKAPASVLRLPVTTSPIIGNQISDFSDNSK